MRPLITLFTCSAKLEAYPGVQTNSGVLIIVPKGAKI